MMVVLFIAWILAEVAAIIAVAHFAGVLICVLALIAGWPIGGWLLRAEGRATLGRLRDAFSSGRSPGPELLDGALALLAGPLFIIPGFLTDALGLALLVPRVRGWAGRWLLRHARGRVVPRAAGFARGARRPYDVDGRATDTPGSPRSSERGPDSRGLLGG